ncbi:hypothetical protein F5887DRAFT_1157559 [Amanita rubescens]|nr:hypothetical protein F5887DRAFT_1157559 [Amanita rubescens]
MCLCNSRYYVAQALRPRLDLHENVEANTVTATFELPGLTKESVDIHVHNGRLHITKRRKQNLCRSRRERLCEMLLSQLQWLYTTLLFVNFNCSSTLAMAVLGVRGDHQSVSEEEEPEPHLGHAPFYGL